MKSMRIAIILILVIAFLGCETGRTVERIGVDETVDLSGRWNDTDSRLVAEEMVSDALKRPWLLDFVAGAGEKPVVIVGTVRNKSSEHIEVLAFIYDIERELINSGQVRFVASPGQREEIRRELESQQSWASEETVKRIAAETGADFMMQGIITTQVDAIEGKKVVLYQVDLELINMQTTEKVWIGQKKIKKLIEQSSTEW